MKLEILDIEPRYTGKYTIRVGKFYWLPAIGNPDKRFSEDALRLMRAIRFMATLNFDIEKETFESIKRNAHLIKNISVERIKDEIVKILKA